MLTSAGRREPGAVRPRARAARMTTGVGAGRGSLADTARERQPAGSGNKDNMWRRMVAGHGSWCLRRYARVSVTERMDAAR